jgi:cofilin
MQATMPLELQVLRTAKAAVDEGLMGPADYDVVKAAFTKALAIKGGVDSGFIGENDFAEARREFFQSLGMAGIGGGAPAATAPVAQGRAMVTPPARPPTHPMNGSRDISHDISSSAAVSKPPVTVSIPDKALSPMSSVGHPSPRCVTTPSGISSRGGGASVVENKV